MPHGGSYALKAAVRVNEISLWRRVHVTATHTKHLAHQEQSRARWFEALNGRPAIRHTASEPADHHNVCSTEAGRYVDMYVHI